MDRFVEAIEKKTLIADGAMGTLFQEKGYSRAGEISDALNLSRPQVVTEIYRQYLEAGADLIATNTFNANRYRLPSDNSYEVYQVNYEGARLARAEIKNNDVFLAGSVGPSGKLLYPYGDVEENELFSVFQEQGRGLKEGGVDVFIIETMMDIRELEMAIKALKGYNLPIIAQMVFQRTFRTMMGNTLEEFTALGERLEVQVLGLNCIEDLDLAVELIKRLKEKTDKPLSLYPNAGVPEFVTAKKETVYLLSAEDFARNVQRVLSWGVKIFGGCCGTGPRHIALMKKELEGKNKKTPC